jgi:probable phosphoglycerate mutase
MIYLVRHGQTLWNTEARFQGQFDSPLTELGRAQAERIGRALAAEIGPRAVPIRAYVSPLGRARATAALIGRALPMDIVEEPRLMEVHFGDWEGLTREDILARFGADQSVRPMDWQFQAPGGETLDTVLARVGLWYETAEVPAVVVTHGIISRLVRGLHASLGHAEMLTLPVSQDGFFRLDGGRIDFVPAP